MGILSFEIKVLLGDIGRQGDWRVEFGDSRFDGRSSQFLENRNAIVTVSHKVHVADLVHVDGREALGMRCFVDSFPSVADELLCRQEGPVELLVPARGPCDLFDGNGPGADIVLSPDTEPITHILKGKQTFLVMPGEKAQDPPEKDSATSLGKSFIGSEPNTWV